MGLAGGKILVMEDALLPAAVVLEEDGPRLVLVVEVGGALFDRETGEPLDLASTVVVVGLDAVAA